MKLPLLINISLTLVGVAGIGACIGFPLAVLSDIKNRAWRSNWEIAFGISFLIGGIGGAILDLTILASMWGIM